MNAFIDNVNTVSQSITITQKLLTVLGNESCDLDSAISSIVYAYFLNWCDSLQSNIKKNQDTRIFIPVFNIYKEELPLKTEVTYLLNKVGLKLESLVCLDDLDIKALPDRCNFQLILVDHHILTDGLSSLMPYVTTILDHRPKDEQSWKYDSSVKANITTVGSCATLVCSEIISSEDGCNFFNENRDAAILLHSTIVLDTANFNPSADKARPLDFNMADELEKILGINDVEAYRSKVFSELLTARTDHSSLNSLQLLSRDMKLIQKFPIPGLPMLVEEFLSREDSRAALENFCKHYKTTTILVMGLAVVDNTVIRDLAVYSLQDCKLQEEVVETLLKATEPCLDLEKTSHGTDNCEHFLQKNVKASRKQIVPIIKDMLQHARSEH